MDAVREDLLRVAQGAQAQLQEWLADPRAVQAVAVAVLTLLLAFVLARLLLGRRQRSSLLLVGSSCAGKTALFSRLTDGGSDEQGSLGATTPSMAENVAALRLGRGVTRLVDLPGHPRLRSRLDGYAADARGLVFVVDGREGAFLPGVRDVAQVMLDVLTHDALAARPPPMLLAVNKTDKSGCHSVEFVRRRLEKEIDALRSARGTLGDTAGEGMGSSASSPVMRCPSPFTFAAAGIRLTCGGISVLRSDLAPVTAFAAQLR